MTLIKTADWYETSKGEPRGYIQPHTLQELWFHVGTACNLSCPFCLEGSKPGDTRLQGMKLDDALPYIDEACDMGVERFAFTGGEPFVIKDFVKILGAASQKKPCLVLTNGTKPVLQRLHQVKPLLDNPFPIEFRISIDYPNAERHDQGRGEGSFAESLVGIKELRLMGFDVAVARQMEKGEDTQITEQVFADLFKNEGIPNNTPLVAFPDFLTPNATADVPEVSENCMTTYQDEPGRKAFMCAYTKMLVKIDGAMKVYACTLVDDDPHYDFGSDLRKSIEERVMLKHHRCYSCFAYGASCSG